MEFSLDDLPLVIADRVRAATGDPQFLAIRRAGEWVIEALTGERVVVMRLDVRDDGSVREHTDTFAAASIQTIDMTTDATLTVKTQSQIITVPVSNAFAELLLSARRGN